jgi:hypothetical protein
MIVGSFTNWHYRTMMSLDKFIKEIDQNPEKELVK